MVKWEGKILIVKNHQIGGLKIFEKIKKYATIQQTILSIYLEVIQIRQTSELPYHTLMIYQPNTLKISLLINITIFKILHTLKLGKKL